MLEIDDEPEKEEEESDEILPDEIVARKSKKIPLIARNSIFDLNKIQNRNPRGKIPRLGI